MEEETIRAMTHQLSDDWWKTAGTVRILLDWFRQHLIGLYVAVETNTGPNQGIYTGFPLMHRGYLLWITAGHVIDQLTDLFKRNDISVVRMRWVDNYHVDGAESIPLPTSAPKGISFTDMGVDFGFIFISGLERANILHNKKNQIMNSRAWGNIELAKPEGYYLVGYPKEWTTEDGSKTIEGRSYRKFEANPICLPITSVQRDQTQSHNDFWNDADAFYGRIESFSDGEMHEISDIVGVSGGPLLSIERTVSGQIVYRLFGVQRSWSPNEQVIRAEPIQRIVSLINVVLDELESS